LPSGIAADASLVTFRAIRYIVRRPKRSSKTIPSTLTPSLLTAKNESQASDAPGFATEQEEAQWWYDHREELAKAFADAASRGELRCGSAARRGRQAAAAADARTTTIQLDPDDVSRARALASKRGLRYPDYLTMLLHEALAAEEKRLAG